MVRLLQEHNVAVILMTLPTVVRPGMSIEELKSSNVFFPYFSDAYGVARFLSLNRAYNRTITDVARTDNVEVIDLVQVFEALPDKAPYFLDTMHPSAKGYALIAETLRNRIRKMETQGLL
jgi:hypothetical protein